MSFALLTLGFLIGMRHADAMETDHLAAAASLAARSHSMADTLCLSAVWGLGHTVTLSIFAALG